MGACLSQELRPAFPQAMFHIHMFHALPPWQSLTVAAEAGQNQALGGRRVMAQATGR